MWQLVNSKERGRSASLLLHLLPSLKYVLHVCIIAWHDKFLIIIIIFFKRGNLILSRKVIALYTYPEKKKKLVWWIRLEDTELNHHADHLDNSLVVDVISANCVMSGVVIDRQSHLPVYIVRLDCVIVCNFAWNSILHCSCICSQSHDCACVLYSKILDLIKVPEVPIYQASNCQSSDGICMPQDGMWFCKYLNQLTSYPFCNI